MLKKLLSTFKNVQPSTQNPAETEAAESISSPEKTAALVARLEAAIAALADTPNSPRRMMLRRQYEQAMLAARRHAIESESQRVIAATQRDKVNGEKNLEKAKQAFASAERMFLEKQAGRFAVLARLEPLESRLSLVIQGAADELNAARAALDKAVIEGDEPAEIVAAERLCELEAGTLNPAGPLQLRLAAIRREEAEASKALTVAEQEKNNANEAVMQAKAALALVEYDRQVQVLLDAYAAQAAAVAKCSGALTPAMKIGPLDIDVSSTERVVFGNRIDAFSRRRMPSPFLIRDMINDMTATPDLAILSINVQDIEEPLAETTNSRPMPGGLVQLASGGYETYYGQSPDDVTREQHA